VTSVWSPRDSNVSTLTFSVWRRKVLEPVETRGPEALVPEDPASNVAKGLRVEFEGVLSAMACAADESGGFEHADVFADAGERQGERRHDVGDARRRMGEATDDRPAGGIGNGDDDAIQIACPQ